MMRPVSKDLGPRAVGPTAETQEGPKISPKAAQVTPQGPSPQDLPCPAKGHPTFAQSVAHYAQVAQDVLRIPGSAAMRGAMMGAVSLGMVGCSTLEVEVPLESGGSQRVELRQPVPRLSPARTSNQSRVATFETRRAEDSQLKDLPANIQFMLSQGIMNPRDRGLRGYEGVLGVQGALRSARAVSQLSPGQLRRLQSQLAMAGQGGSRRADAGTEQALILSTLGARGGSEAGLKATIEFAGRIRGLSRGELIRRTTLLDVQDFNSSRVDPDALSGPASDRFGDNDGLYQRFTTTCVPTVAQMMRGERDPAYAFEVHASLHTLQPFAGGGAEQAAVHESSAGPVASRLATQRPRAVLVDADRLVDALAPGLRDSFLAYVSARPVTAAQQGQVQTAVQSLQAQGHDLTLADLEALRAAQVSPGAGMLFSVGLAAVLKSGRVEERAFNGKQSLRTMVAGLQQGDDFVIRVAGSAGGHALLVSDVRGAKGREHLLVSDPWEGRTAWVSQSDFLSGRFLYTTFRLGHEAVTHYFPWQTE